jgi:hypothetical protein
MYIVLLVLLVVLGNGFMPSPMLAGQPGSRVSYVGGTISGLSGRVQGIIQTTDSDVFFFRTKRIRIEVPYERINLLEYGQKASRRYALGIVVSPVLLLSKKRKHYLTIGYADEEGKQQAMVFQVDKNDVRAVVASLEAKTGRRLQYQDDEARKGLKD